MNKKAFKNYSSMLNILGRSVKIVLNCLTDVYWQNSLTALFRTLAPCSEKDTRWAPTSRPTTLPNLSCSNNVQERQSDVQILY